MCTSSVSYNIPEKRKLGVAQEKVFWFYIVNNFTKGKFWDN